MSGQSPESSSLGPGGSDPVLTRTAAGESASQTPAGDTPPPPRQNQVIREILRGNIVTTILAIVLAMLIGGILVALTDIGPGDGRWCYDDRARQVRVHP